MKHHVDIINGINNIFIEISKGEVSDVEISRVTDKYKNLLKKMDNVYRCLRTLYIDDFLIDKARIILKIQ